MEGDLVMVRIFSYKNELYTTREARKVLKTMKLGEKIALIKDDDKKDGETENEEEDKIEGVDKI